LWQGEIGPIQQPLSILKHPRGPPSAQESNTVGNFAGVPDSVSLNDALP